MSGDLKKEFMKRKEKVLLGIQKGVDKSMKGSIDKPVMSLISLINKNPDMCSLSSCSGRICVVEHFLPKSKYNNKFLVNSHENVSFEHINKTIKNSVRKSPKKEEKEIYFKVEPFILALETLNLKTAVDLVNLAKTVGFKNSGLNIKLDKNEIIKKIVVTLRGSNHLEIPIWMSSLDDYVSDDYVQFVVEKANALLSDNFTKIVKFENLVNCHFF